MKKLSLILLGVGLLIGAPTSAFAKVNVFACAPEWGALAQQIGGANVDVYNASNANQDIHHMRAKPSLLAAMRRADIVIGSGASLEVGWLPILLNKAGSSQVQEGAIGSIMASDYVDRLEIMQQTVDRSMGHIHPEGNPHVHMNPHNLIKIADVVMGRLSDIDQSNAQTYQSNNQNFKTTWNSLISQWEAKASSLKSANIVVYHKSWAYLLNWLGVNVIASLEPKPGVPPTASHLEKVLQNVQGKKVLGILVAPFESEKAARWLSEKTSIPVMRLPYTVGGEDADTLEQVFEQTIQIMTK